MKSKKEVDTGFDENNGLKYEWQRFIDAYIANGGNGMKAYLVAYPKSSEDAARSSAPVLLARPSVKDEINYRYTTQKVTDDAIIGELWDLVRMHKSGKGAIVAMKSLEVLAKTKGMLTDTKRIVFSGENPALFTSKVSDENRKKFEEANAKGERITE